MTKKERDASEEYMARPDLSESLKAANRGYLGADDWAAALEADGADKAKPLRDELQSWQAFAQAPWKPTAGLLEAVSKLERDCPATLPLSRAVDLMAFGSEATPNQLTDTGILEAGAHRRRAFADLRGAAWQGKFLLEHGADCKSIKPGQFKSIQGMGGEIDSLEFNDSKDGEPDKRLEAVQIVDAARFYAWIRELCGSPPMAKGEGAVRTPEGARVIPTQPLGSTTAECVRLALLETSPFDEGYVTRDWTWQSIATHIQEPYKRRMKERYRTENAAPSVASVRRVFGEG